MRTALKLLAAGSAALLVTVISLSSMNSVPMASAAQADYFLKIEGVEGEIQIESWSWGVSNSVARDSASGQATGKRQYQPIIIRKRIDKTSPLLYKAIVDGKLYKKATLTRRSSDGTQAYTVTLQDILVSSFQHDGIAGSPPAESVSFTYQKIEWK